VKVGAIAQEPFQSLECRLSPAKEMSMKPKTLVSVFVLSLVAMTSASTAQERPLTREEVKAELHRSMTNGEYQYLHSETAPGAMWWDRTKMSSGAHGRSYSGTSSTGSLTGDDARRQADELRRQIGFEGS
jgi:hypothetical protein